MSAAAPPRRTAEPANGYESKVLLVLTVIIGAVENSVVFDFKPSVQAGAEMLGRRGEDQRFFEERPAATRRREIDDIALLAQDERQRFGLQRIVLDDNYPA